jgi:hypothetical protein
LAFATGLAAALQAQFLRLVQAAQALWNLIAAFAQAAFAGIAAAAAALLGELRSLWQAGVGALGATWDAVTAAAQAVLDGISAAVTAFWEQLQALWQAGVDAVSALWAVIVAAAQGAFDAIVAGLTAAWDFITSLWNSGIERLVGFLGQLRDFAIGVWNAIAAAAQAALGVQQQAAGETGGFARGGPVVGAGTAMSDSIPAFLSNGEFVIRAAAVRKYGLSLFDALNRMRVDPSAFQRFAEGGLARSLQALVPQPLRLAEGGLVASPSGALRPINLTIGADSFTGLLAPEDLAQKLMRLAVTQQVRSAGRKPRYYGGGR